ncbi:MAG: DNA mismatch repair protein MutS [Deltaproteobacteria bacterium]|nr:DNA mismatch repair protein MutS [Deltaproteobacteria bacterium]
MSLVDSKTPMMVQFNALKQEHPDCVLFFRSGDFYEMFGKDAEVASEILEIALTTRNKTTENAVSMCGVPHHAYEQYLNKLTAAGIKVAIAEQMEEATPGKGLVRREVVRVVTPGTTVASQLLQSDSNLYIAALEHRLKNSPFGLALADLSTGEFELLEFPKEDLARLEGFLQRVRPRELLMPEPRQQTDLEAATGEAEAFAARLTGTLKTESGTGPHLEILPRSWWESSTANTRLTRHFQVAGLDGFGVGHLMTAQRAAGALLAYLEQTQKCDLNHLSQLRPRRLDNVMWLDEATLRNLEVFDNPQPGGKRHTLFTVLNKTRTAMGARTLRRWLSAPLVDRQSIVERQSAVEELKSNLMGLEKLREDLARIRDLERLIGRVSLPVAAIADVIQMREALSGVGRLPGHMGWFACPLLDQLAREFDPLEDIHHFLESRFLEEPSLKVTEGGFIAQGVLPELDQLRALSANSREVLSELEAREKAATGISTLKIRFNRVFGYYLEASRTNQDKIPAHYIRKQTLVNAERYTTLELQALEEKILEAEEKINQLEYDEFQSIRTILGGYARRMQETARQIATLDCLAALAQAAQEYNYARPEILPRTTPPALSITAGRHPVVERIDFDEPFVPNNLDMAGDDNQILLLTGPNMAGKSTTMRQVALIVLMAQTGSFVPARAASLTLADRIFTRVGASDNLARGQSTFMLEMTEAANILNNATPASLIILDEIGRGTSTFDGISIAWAMAEALHQLGPLTLFATHYHELTQLTRELPRVRNFNIAIREEGDHLVFTRKLRPGEADKSYGIHVAKLAGLPQAVIRRADQVMEELVRGASNTADGMIPAQPNQPDQNTSPPQPEPRSAPQKSQLSFLNETHPVVEELKGLNLEQMTPLDALNTLHRLQKRLDKG